MKIPTKHDLRSKILTPNCILVLLLLIIQGDLLIAQLDSTEQRANLSGYVVDRFSGEPLVGCNIFSQMNAFIGQTNNYGFFNFERSKDISFLVFTYVGYTSLKVSIDSLESQGKIKILLTPGFELQTVEISAREEVDVQFGQLNLPTERLMEIPVLGGEPDIFKSLATLPGVANGLEGTSGLLVRGGSPDQNLVLLDDAMVYNTSLLAGFVTIFNPLAIKNVNLYKGNFPARYGGRLSSVVDITMKDGSNTEYGGDFTIGLINSSFLFEGPVKKNESSLVVAGRATYSGLLTSLITTQIVPESNLDFFVYDLNLKYNSSLNKRNRVYVSAFRGQNTFGNTIGDDFEESYFAQTTQNNTATLRHTYNAKNGSFLTNVLAFNNYDSGSLIRYNSENDNEQVSHTNRNSVTDLTLRSRIDLPVFGSHSIKAGYEVIFKYMIPSRIEREVKNMTDPTFIGLSGPQINSREINFFVEDQYRIRQSLSLIYGVRFANYFLDSVYFSNLEPRISIEYSTQIGKFNLGYSRMSQPLHFLLSNFTFPQEIWLPATRQLGPQLSDIFSIGYAKKLLTNKLLLHTEFFYKKLFNQVDFKGEVIPFFNLSNSNNWEDILSGNGIGTIKGLEILLRYTDNRIDSWVAYTLSSNMRIDPLVNNGRPYRQIFDRPHQLSVVTSCKLNKPFTLSATLVSQSGSLFTIPTGLFRDFFGKISPLYESINNFRAPTNFRIDIGFSWNYTTKKGNRSSWNISVYNLFAQQNINVINFLVSAAGNDPNLRLGQLFGTSFYRAIPSFNYKYSFGVVNQEKYLIY